MADKSFVTATVGNVGEHAGTRNRTVLQGFVVLIPLACRIFKKKQKNCVVVYVFANAEETKKKTRFSPSSFPCVVNGQNNMSGF